MWATLGSLGVKAFSTNCGGIYYPIGPIPQSFLLSIAQQYARQPSQIQLNSSK
jgi:hypothetical protein